MTCCGSWKKPLRSHRSRSPSLRKCYRWFDRPWIWFTAFSPTARSIWSNHHGERRQGITILSQLWPRLLDWRSRETQLCTCTKTAESDLTTRCSEPRTVLMFKFESIGHVISNSRGRWSCASLGLAQAHTLQHKSALDGSAYIEILGSHRWQAQCCWLVVGYCTAITKDAQKSCSPIIGNYGSSSLDTRYVDYRSI